MEITKFKLKIKLGICSEPLAIITELAPNGSLDVYLKKNLQIDLNQKKKWMKQISTGIGHLHSEEIIHKDLAARNILLGENLIAKVSDFGLSRILEDSNTSHTTQSTVGPIKWMVIFEF